MRQMGTSVGYEIVACERDDTYRYSLSVRTDHDSPPQKRLVVIQCNPSIANKTQSDPTVGKVSVWAEDNGFREVVFLNLFAFISPYTCDLAGKDYELIVGPRNDDVLREHIGSNATVVLAWGGDVPDHYFKRLHEIKAVLDGAGVLPHKVGALSRGGTYPRHGRVWNRGNRELSVLDWNAIIA